MEIKPNNSYGPAPVGEVPAAYRARRPNGDTGDFKGTEALRQALDDTPDVRPEAVARGQALVAADEYPPAEVMHRLAVLLASGLAAGGTGDQPVPAPTATFEPPAKP